MNYYYEGCVSWSWYYPYQYAPFTSDFKGFSHSQVDFYIGNYCITLIVEHIIVVYHYNHESIFVAVS